MKSRILNQVSRIDGVESAAVIVAARSKRINDVIFRRVHAQARQDAKRQWMNSQRWRAIESLKIAEAKYGANVETSLILAKYFKELNLYPAALSSVFDALHLEPSNSFAVSLLFDCEAEIHIAKVVVESKLESYVRDLESRPDSFFSALYLLAGRRKRSKSAALAVRKILNELEADPIAAEVGSRLVADDRDAVSNRSLSEEELRLASLVTNVIVGKSTQVIKEIRNVPVDRWPTELMLLAASGERRKGRAEVADRYASIASVSKGTPGTSRLRRFARTLSSARISQEIYENGFPFSARSTTRQFEPVANRSFYFLHNSLPYNSAGYATRTHGLLTALAKKGWQPEGVTRLGYPSDNYDHDINTIPKYSEVDEIRYHHLVDPSDSRMPKTPVVDYQKRFVEAATPLVLDRKPAILHAASNHWNGLTIAELGRQHNLPTVYEVRGLWEVTRASREPGYFGSDHYLQKAALEADAANACDRVLTITNALREEMVSRGVPEEKITVVPNGVDTARFQPLKKDPLLYESLNVNGRVVIGYVGSILDYEGLDLLLDAAERVLRVNDDVLFLVVGDGAAAPKLRDEVARRGLERSFVMTGRVPHHEVESYYSIIDICPFPRRPLPVCEMVSPLKPFEALAMQKAVVVSNVAAMAEIIRDGDTGLHYQKGSVDDLVDKLLSLVNDAQKKTDLSRNGLEWVRANRSWNHLGGIVSGLYESLGAVPRQ